MALTTLNSWSIHAPTPFLHEEHDSYVVEHRNFGGGLIVPIGGVAIKIWGGTRSFFLYQSCPGMIPLYFTYAAGVIHFSQSLWAMRSHVKKAGLKIKDIHSAKEGVAYHVSQRGLRRYVVDPIKYELNPSPTIEKAGTKLLSKLVDAAKFMEGRGKVLTLISGGTDGILSALALREAGIDQLCVCIGRTEEDFDPMYARSYAKQLGLEYQFMSLPADDAGLENLLTRSLHAIEMADFSNVLMGMCNQMIAEYARDNGFGWVINADIADVVLGNDIFTFGSFKKDYPEPTPKQWAEKRITTQLKTLPTNIQIYKAFNFNGVRVAQLFADRRVIEFLLGQTLDMTPPEHKKPLYYEILDRYLGDGSWVGTGKKVGYYTGSGIGKIRLDNPVLSDDNIRSIFTKLQETE